MADNQQAELIALAENYLRQLAPHVATREAAQIMRDLVAALKVAAVKPAESFRFWCDCGFGTDSADEIMVHSCDGRQHG